MAEGGDLNLLIKKGTATQDELHEVWEGIIRSSAKATSDLSYLNYFELAKVYAMFAAQYNLIRAHLMILCMEFKQESVNIVQQFGYKITGYQPGSINSEAYALSIQNAFTRTNNLLTKMMTKQKQMKEYVKDGDGGGNSFAKALANITAAIGVPMQSDITLAMYNEFKIIAKQKHAHNK